MYQNILSFQSYTGYNTSQNSLTKISQGRAIQLETYPPHRKKFKYVNLELETVLSFCTGYHLLLYLAIFIHSFLVWALGICHRDCHFQRSKDNEVKGNMWKEFLRKVKTFKGHLLQELNHTWPKGTQTK